VIAILADDIAGTFKNEFVEAPRHAAREMLAVLLTAMTSGTPVECHVVQNNQARNFFAVP
jgi:hypothetical protein